MNYFATQNVKKLNNKEALELLEKYFGDDVGDIKISHLDFGKASLIARDIKAYSIDNSYQVSEKYIYNTSQRAKDIWNESQIASTFICNIKQKSSLMNNSEQEASVMYMTNSKVEKKYY